MTESQHILDVLALLALVRALTRRRSSLLDRRPGEDRLVRALSYTRSSRGGRAHRA